MSKPQFASEPSMEDILASIRKMISDDSPGPQPDARPDGAHAVRRATRPPSLAAAGAPRRTGVDSGQQHRCELQQPVGCAQGGDRSLDQRRTLQQEIAERSGEGPSPRRAEPLALPRQSPPRPAATREPAAPSRTAAPAERVRSARAPELRFDFGTSCTRRADQYANAASVASPAAVAPAKAGAAAPKPKADDAASHRHAVAISGGRLLRARVRIERRGAQRPSAWLRAGSFGSRGCNAARAPDACSGGRRARARRSRIEQSVARDGAHTVRARSGGGREGSPAARPHAAAGGRAFRGAARRRRRHGAKGAGVAVGVHLGRGRSSAASATRAWESTSRWLLTRRASPPMPAPQLRRPTQRAEDGPRRRRAAAPDAAPMARRQHAAHRRGGAAQRADERRQGPRQGEARDNLRRSRACARRAA